MMVEKIEWYRAIEFLVFIIPRTLVISYTPYLDMVLNEEVGIDGKNNEEDLYFFLFKL